MQRCTVRWHPTSIGLWPSCERVVGGEGGDGLGRCAPPTRPYISPCPSFLSTTHCRHRIGTSPARPRPTPGGPPDRNLSSPCSASLLSARLLQTLAACVTRHVAPGHAKRPSRRAQTSPEALACSVRNDIGPWRSGAWASGCMPRCNGCIPFCVCPPAGPYPRGRC